MRRSAALLSLPLVIAAAIVLPSPAGAQQPGEDVVLRLVHQTPWNDPDHTNLSLQVRAVNATAQEFDDLSLVVTIETHTGSRTEYESSLESDTGEVLSAIPTLLTGSLSPRSSRVIRVPAIDLSVLAQT